MAFAPRDCNLETLGAGAGDERTGGTNVCLRHSQVQVSLLQALRWEDQDQDSCAEITWTDLILVESLHLESDHRMFPAVTLRA